ncbi:MAG: enoyl-CoA hydratase/isomerase family protein [Actinomycetota bacterium]
MKRVNVGRMQDVAILEMDRPSAKNAMDTPMLNALIDALLAVSTDTGFNAVVITGAGGTFSAGADIAEVVDPQGAVARMRRFAQLYELVVGFPKPVVAAISGHCVGGGAEVATACDLRVADKTAKIRFPGAAFGIPVGTARLPLLVGLSHAKDLLMTTRTVEAEEAFRLGLFNRLVDAPDLLTDSATIASEIAANPGAMVQKRSLDAASGLASRTGSENRSLRRWQKDQS